MHLYTNTLTDVIYALTHRSISNVTLRANVIDLVELNDTAIFTCSVSSGSSPLSYHWLNGSSEVTARDGIQLGDGGRTLTIANVTQYDQGPYRCIVSNPVSREPSQNVTLTISSESRPPAQFQWLLNGTLLSNMGPELRLENIHANQSGSYSCWAHNIRTLRYQTSEPSDITVLEPISGAIITTTPNPPIIEGNSVTLTCAASGSIITREWMKDGQLLSAGGNIIISEDKRVLSINPVKRTDSGEYLCRVGNPISTADANHSLIVNSDGSLTPGLSAGAITGIVIGVLLVVGLAVGVPVYCTKKKGLFKKESSSGNGVGNSTSSANGGGPGGNQDLNYADITQFQKRDGGSVQLGNLGTSSTEYAQVRVNNRPSQPAEPPTYQAHQSQSQYSQVNKPALKTAPDAASTIYSDVRRN
ncbi:hypothetical protein J4Q44_G00023310 [Coregonus suidteri]|uniref:Ig-like domain-containing protein n=1 Tax=Coregonus suidteri TaxID=861788 RepID=A0AAN8NFZ7_9TELE